MLAGCGYDTHNPFLSMRSCSKTASYYDLATECTEMSVLFPGNRQIHTQYHTQNDYNNPYSACVPRVNDIVILMLETLLDPLIGNNYVYSWFDRTEHPNDL